MLLTPPRGGQAKALELCKRFEGFLLFPEQRVGKSWIALATADYRRPRKLLIITRKGGKRVWTKELKLHLKIDWPCEVRIESHEFFSRSKAPKEVRKWLKQCDRSECMIILDESHKIKKRGSGMSMRIRQIAKRYAQYRLALSGTPIGEGLEDGWTQMDFVDPSVFGTYEEFNERFCIMGGFRGVKIVGYRNEVKFRKLLASRSYRITLREAREKSLLVRTSKVYINLPDDIMQMHQDFKDGVEVEFHRRKIKLKKLMHAATKCQQLAGGFLIRGYDDDGEPLAKKEVLTVHHSKINALHNILQRHPNEKIVVSAKYRHELRAIRRLCIRDRLTYKIVRGGEPYDGVFNVDVVIIQSQSGIAIDLSPSSIAIFFSLDYSFIVNAQMRSRILSYTKRFVRYYYLLSRGTADEDAYAAWVAKKNMSDIILDRWRR